MVEKETLIYLFVASLVKKLALFSFVGFLALGREKVQDLPGANHLAPATITARDFHLVLNDMVVCLQRCSVRFASIILLIL